MNLRLPSQDSTTGRSLKSGFYGAVAAVVTFLVTLWGVIHGVPGCADVIVQYAREHWLELAIQLGAAIGLQTGALSFIVNSFRPSVKQY